MIDLTLRRRFFAEELEAVCTLRSPALVAAFAAVPREAFLRPGPWTVLAETDYTISGAMRLRPTPDADPARVYHNIPIAIDHDRQLFNGQPGTIGVWIDALDLAPGERVLHIGCGLGYFTAVMGECVGATGQVVACDVDEALAAEAQRNVASRPWITVRHGDGSDRLDGPFDAILVNAGVTHPLDAWLDALAPGGRMILPLTATMAVMGSHISKGLVLLLTRTGPDAIAARVFGVVAIYSAMGVRDEGTNQRLGKALAGGPAQWQTVARLRRDVHEAASSCWLHGSTWCFSAA
jgi:protein-L-isoaspartate(D-aspartate) O-methyltransferase